MENRLIIDCSLFTNKETLHQAMKEKLQDNNYIGNNLDALFDTLTSINTPTELIFTNVSAANSVLGDYFDRFIKVIMTAVNENSNLNVKLSY